MSSHCDSQTGMILRVNLDINDQFHWSKACTYNLIFASFN